MGKELHRLEEDPKPKMHIDLLRVTLKKVPKMVDINSDLKKKCTFIHDRLVIKMNRFLQETDKPRMDYQRNNLSDPKRSPNKNRPQQLQTHDMPYVEITNGKNKRGLKQHPTRNQLYGHLPLITKTIQARRTRHAGHNWRSKGEIISDVLLWTPTYGRAKAGRPARTYIQQLCEDTGCSPEDLPEAMNGRSGERGSGISVKAARHDDDDIYIYIYIYI